MNDFELGGLLLCVLVICFILFILIIKEIIGIISKALYGKRKSKN
jgi:hypothetical protein